MNLKTPSKARNDGSALSKEDLQELRDGIEGEVLLKHEASKDHHEAAVKRWNEVYIKQANIVVFVKDEDDVVKCVRFADKHHLDVAVAGGRHSYHGASSSTGFVIDLQRMRKVSIDKSAMTATAQGGCLARDVEEPAEAEGLSVGFGAVNETGIGGLTLGGGAGWLTGRDGLTLDNLLAVRIALASGDIVNASEAENADLFWGIRGGGGNFGIVTEFKYRAHEQGPVFMEILIFTPDKLQACIGLINKMHAMAVEPGDGKLQLLMAFMTPPGSPAMCPAYILFYDGPEDEAKVLAKPLYDLGPAHTMGGMTSYAKTTEPIQMTKIDGFDRYAASSTHMEYPVDETLISDVFQRFQKVKEKYGNDVHPSKCIVDLRNYRKVASVPVSATAYSGRRDTSFIVPDLQWDDPKLDVTLRKEVSGITAYVKERLQEARVSAHVQDDGQHDVAAIYPNLADGVEKLTSVFGTNLQRLQELKAKYDPDSMWDKWFPITPA